MEGAVGKATSGELLWVVKVLVYAAEKEVLAADTFVALAIRVAIARRRLDDLGLWGFDGLDGEDRGRPFEGGDDGGKGFLRNAEMDIVVLGH
jgi:hypothetical protein